MQQAIDRVEETLELVQDKQEIVELPHDLLDRVGGGIILLVL
jgi:hypothetical protein